MRVPWRKQTSFAPHTWFSGMPQPRWPTVSDTALPFRGRDVPASQYLALHWLSSPLIHHPALDLKERNGINHPAWHTARLPGPFGGSCGSLALCCLCQECFLVGSLCLVEGGLRHTWKTKGSCASPTGTGGSPRHPQESPQSMMRKTLLKDNLGHFLLGQQYFTVTTPAPAHISDLTCFPSFQIPDWINALEDSTTKNDCATNEVSMSVCIWHP